MRSSRPLDEIEVTQWGHPGSPDLNVLPWLDFTLEATEVLQPSLGGCSGISFWGVSSHIAMIYVQTKYGILRFLLLSRQSILIYPIMLGTVVYVYLYVCVNVCVYISVCHGMCVCEREGERERVRTRTRT